MFRLSLGARPAPGKLPVLAERALAPGRVLVLAGEPGSLHLRETAAGFRVELSPLAPAPATPAALDVAIDWNGEAGELWIRSEPQAGSAVYYHGGGDGDFACASRIELLREVGVPFEEDAARLPDYFRYRYLTPPYTLFRDIRQLAKARLRVRVTAGRCHVDSPRRYVVFPERPLDGDDPAAMVERTRQLLEAALAQLGPRADAVVVPLSGGMDSSVLFRLAQRTFGPSDAWSAGYPFEADAHNRERRYAASAAEAFGARHRYHAGSTPDYLAALIRSVAAAEEPLHHLQSAMFELLFRDAVPPERNLVVMGTGASGVFGSPLQQLLHRNGRQPRLWRALARSPLPALVAAASRRTGRARRLARRLALPGRQARALPDPGSLLASVDAYGDPAWIAARFGATPPQLVHSRSELLADYPGRELLEQIALIDFFDKTQFLWAKILQSVGRRAHFPFMQPELQQHVLGIPWAIRLQRNKWVLAEVARSLGVPEFILGRAKSGFGVRRDDWALRGGPLEPLVALAARRVDESELRELQSREPGRAQAFWCLLNLGLWRRLCLDGEPADALLAELRVGAADASGSPARTGT